MMTGGACLVDVLPLFRERSRPSHGGDVAKGTRGKRLTCYCVFAVVLPAFVCSDGDGTFEVQGQYYDILPVHVRVCVRVCACVCVCVCVCW